MITVIGVRFRTAGKIYYFDPAGRQIKTGDHVTVSYTHLDVYKRQAASMPGSMVFRAWASISLA